MNQRNSFLQEVKQICKLTFTGNFKELIWEETDNSLLQFCRYCLVGAMATVVDFGVLYLVSIMGVHYLIAAVISFVFGLICNYSLSKLIVFNGNKTAMSMGREFAAYGIIGVIGLVLTLVLMYVMTEWLRLFYMVSKVIATILVLMWNYLAKKYLIY